ncbi:hypothetical protein C1645_458795 [Glomus cerebriforme]|uniref:Uncharacterized protein n=1 Tax=Glomus cerebriforme TaxID=658196 RepID=A0A397SH28_9GLOM|nr:hypothetical protein C1645_458795 [Glomus cerebriforme]
MIQFLFYILYAHSVFSKTFISRGMISYEILGQKGHNWNPLYLIVTWKVKLIGKNSLSVNVLEYKPPPLENKTREEKVNLYKKIHKQNKTYPETTAKWPTNDNGSIFSVRGRIDTKYMSTLKALLVFSFIS